jgi:hypothetical protein
MTLKEDSTTLFPEIFQFLRNTKQIVKSSERDNALTYLKNFHTGDIMCRELCGVLVESINERAYFIPDHTVTGQDTKKIEKSLKKGVSSFLKANKKHKINEMTAWTFYLFVQLRRYADSKTEEDLNRVVALMEIFAKKLQPSFWMKQMREPVPAQYFHESHKGYIDAPRICLGIISQELLGLDFTDKFKFTENEKKELDYAKKWSTVPFLEDTEYWLLELMAKDSMTSYHELTERAIKEFFDENSSVDWGQLCPGTNVLKDRLQFMVNREIEKIKNCRKM